MRAKVVNINFGDEYDVYIGRAGKGHDGKWGNPFKKGTVQENISNYYRYMQIQLMRGNITDEDLVELHGKRLGCFCAPDPCHGDALALLAEEAHARLAGS